MVDQLPAILVLAPLFGALLIGLIGDRDHRDTQLRGLLHGDRLTPRVHHEHGTGQAPHVLHAHEVLVELEPLAIQHQALFLRVELEGVLFVTTTEFFHPTNLTADGLEVGEHSTQPTLRHIERATTGCFFFDDTPELALRGEEKNPLTTENHPANRILSRLKAVQGFAEVDDVDPVAFPEDVGTHFGVPPTGLVSEVDSRLKQLVQANVVHELGTPYRLLNWKRFRALGRPGFFRSTSRASRVNIPLLRREERISSSLATRARASPKRMASA